LIEVRSLTTGLPKALSEWWRKKGTQNRAKRRVLSLTRAPRRVEAQRSQVPEFASVLPLPPNYRIG
jgi:hypothetical protein